MNKEPESRYDTAQELADDLRRFLESKPVKAKRPTIWEQTVKWGRRHPSIVASCLVTLALAVVMLSATVIVVGWERKATKEALGLLVEQKRAALRSANEATMQARLAEQSAWWVTQGITEPLKKLANPDLAKDPIFAQARRDVLDEAVLVYEQFLKFLAARPGEERLDEGTLIHIALLHTIADDHPKAQAAYARAIESAELRARELPGIAVSEWLVAQTHSHLGMELWDVGKHVDSRPHFSKAREAFRRAVALEPNEIRVINSAAWFLNFFQDPGYRDPETALVLARRLVSLTSERESNRLHLTAGLRSFFTLGLAEYRVANYGEARRALERSMELRDGGDAYEWFVMAMVLARQGEPARARRLHEEAVRWMRRFRYSDFELHFLDEEARALIGATDHSQSNNKREENAEQHSKP
jgi:tetratricopeptide (TPR) repeat protein